jgi:NAD(P)-dependent dehydrogenase (short-subunit alcohol dehydrogenase family)
MNRSSTSRSRRFDGQTVVVTGASAGVGRAVALAFARAGARVAALARGAEALDALRREAEAAHGRLLALPVDVADAAAVEAAAARVEAELGPIDVWVNNAMVTIFAPLQRISPAEFRRATEITYLGTVHGTMAALSRMRPRRQGAIIQVGSALSYRAIPLQSVYCGAKFAIRGFTDAVRVELMHEKAGIALTMVQLSAFNTPQFDWALSRMPRRAQPVPPIFQPEVAARAIVWAARRRPRELVVGWPALKAIWAAKLAPHLADRLLARMGYDSQMTAEPEAPQRPHNLERPVAGLHRTHGRFDAQARPASAQAWLATHGAWVGGAAVAVVLLFGLAGWWLGSLV